MKKVEEFKKNKIVKTERKKKWELWKKTKAMMWKKSSTNYTKWDVFTSSSEDESEKVDPILPKNDPNFIGILQINLKHIFVKYLCLFAKIFINLNIKY